MTEDRQSNTIMVELIGCALKMLTERVGKIERRLDVHRTQLNELDENIDEAVDMDTVVELIKDIDLATPSCVHGKCKKCRRSEESARDHNPKCRRTILRSSHQKIR